MPETSRLDIPRLCRRQLDKYLSRSPETVLPLPRETILARLSDLYLRNQESGRFARYARDRKEASPAEYINLLILHWLAEYPRVERLARRDQAEWGKLQADLRRVAGGMLTRLAPAFSSASSVEDYAQRACDRIYESVFPFDVPFDAWARMILRRLILEQYRSADVLDHPHHSIDELYPNAEGASGGRETDVQDSASADEFARILDHAHLLEALDRMESELQRAVITLTYFEGLSDAQIAQRLGKRVPNIQTIRHRALSRVRRILSSDGVKEKGPGVHQEE